MRIRDLIRNILLTEAPVQKELNQEELYLLQKVVKFCRENMIYDLKTLDRKSKELVRRENDPRKNYYQQIIDRHLGSTLIQTLYLDDAMGYDSRKLYAYTWKDGTAYVGLTCDLKRRGKQHQYCQDDSKRRTAVGEEIKKRFDQGLPKEDALPEYQVIESKFLTAVDASNKEEEWYYDMIELGYNMLNDKDALGNLGSAKKSPFDVAWDKIGAGKLRTLEDLKRVDPIVFDYVKYEGPKKFGFKGEKSIPQSPEQIKKLLPKHGTNEKEFQDNLPIVYGKAKTKGWLDAIFEPKLQIEYSNGETKNYESFNELMKNLSNKYKPSIFRNKLRDEGVLENQIDSNGETVTVKYLNYMQERYYRNLRNLIREALIKEETTPDDVQKGIDIAIKMLKKEYPFVVGWDYSDPPETYTYKVYINLEIDFLKAMEFYNLKPHPRYGKFIKDAIEKRETLPYPFSMMNYEDEGFDTNEVFNLQNYMSEIYEDMIPYKLKMKQGEKGVFNQNDPKELAVDNYIFVE